jgi:hypothetical protein
MKRYFFILFSILFFPEVKGQIKNTHIRLKFVTEKGDTICFCDSEIRSVADVGFKVTNSSKIEKLETNKLVGAYYYSDRNEQSSIYFQNRLSSAVPPGPYYIYGIGAKEIHVIEKSVIPCSADLTARLKADLGKMSDE